MSDDVLRYLNDLVSPFGGPEHQTRREQALAFLVAHADDAYPRLLAMIDAAAGTGPVAALRALPLFGRPDAVPVLAAVLRNGNEAIAGVAANALADHPDARAEDALVDALNDRREAVVEAATSALHTRRSAHRDQP